MSEHSKQQDEKKGRDTQEPNQSRSESLTNEEGTQGEHDRQNANEGKDSGDPAKGKSEGAKARADASNLDPNEADSSGEDDAPKDVTYTLADDLKHVRTDKEAPDFAGNKGAPSSVRNTPTPGVMQPIYGVNESKTHSKYAASAQKGGRDDQEDDQDAGKAEQHKLDAPKHATAKQPANHGRQSSAKGPKTAKVSSQKK